jgi:hypothetical protein
MFQKVFLDHPADVGETYGEHLREASGFGLRMIGGGVACMIHALLPAVFVTSASTTVAGLHETLVRKRGAKRAAGAELRSAEWVI